MIFKVFFNLNDSMFPLHRRLSRGIPLQEFNIKDMEHELFIGKFLQYFLNENMSGPWKYFFLHSQC